MISPYFEKRMDCPFFRLSCQSNSFCLQFPQYSFWKVYLLIQQALIRLISCAISQRFRFFTSILVVAQSKCLQDPCANGGTCIESIGGTGYECRCPVGYKGVNCEGNHQHANFTLNNGRGEEEAEALQFSFNSTGNLIM